MHDRRIPEWLRHAPAPSVRGFALLAGTEAVARGILISVFPLAIVPILTIILLFLVACLCCFVVGKCCYQSDEIRPLLDGFEGLADDDDYYDE
mgnify:CR=1 FL=1